MKLQKSFKFKNRIVYTVPFLLLVRGCIYFLHCPQVVTYNSRILIFTQVHSTWAVKPFIILDPRELARGAHGGGGGGRGQLPGRLLLRAGHRARHLLPGDHGELRQVGGGPQQARLSLLHPLRHQGQPPLLHHVRRSIRCGKKTTSTVCLRALVSAVYGTSNLRTDTVTITVTDTDTDTVTATRHKSLSIDEIGHWSLVVFKIIKTCFLSPHLQRQKNVVSQSCKHHKRA